VVNQKLGGEIDTMVMHHSVRREYIKLLNADRRYSGSNLSNPNGGTVAMKQGDLSLGEVTVKAIRSVGLAQVYFLDTKRSGFKRTSRRKGSSKTATVRFGSVTVQRQARVTRSKRGGIVEAVFLHQPRLQCPVGWCYGSDPRCGPSRVIPRPASKDAGAIPAVSLIWVSSLRVAGPFGL
jgi:hypothetical protein